ncbi:MAG: 4Fe-4S cluster-binding domain-containing protein [Candidatus Sumerlaeota bacterium]|nr:4Fe-4S cluster-binding domain-containing protein [Candidatus Sumerlaeota bacterium]
MGSERDNQNLEPGTRNSELGTEFCCDCPRRCGVPMDGGTGFCGADGKIRIASMCLHRGEEPAISGSRGSITLFLPGCNLRCMYCQNWQISRRSVVALTPATPLETLIDSIVKLIERSGHNLNFVSPSHNARQVRTIIQAVRERGYETPVVYNTNGYDSLETLRSFEGLVDIYMPDMKYGEPEPARLYSSAPDYVAVATAALTEMRRQVGRRLFMDENGVALRGILVRHLVLPGLVSNSLRALEIVADVLTPEVHLSLMAQYHPDAEAVRHPVLGRYVLPDEYEAVVKRAHELGFENGWIQDLSAPGHYRPDFQEDHPFERKGGRK